MRCLRFVLPGILLLASVLAPEAHALAGLTMGFSGDPVLTSGSAATRATWIARALSEGAELVAVDVGWSAVAPAVRPAGFVAADPAAPGYDWSAVDDQVRDLASHGLKVDFNISFAPTWAEGANPPQTVVPGTWKPSSAQFKAFATAIARRYDGHFPDPLQPGRSLPRVRYYEAWNEPNLSTYLTPQWTRTGRGYAPASPVIYRSLLNAFYSGVKRVSKSDLVVAGATAPYGDLPGGQRMQPVAFDRTLFCERDNARLTATKCPDPPHLDALSHHPYGIGGPLWHALNADDVAVPDMYKLANVLHAAQRTGHVLPRGPKRLWVTEISWDSSPPDPHGVPVERQARWLEQSMYVLWRQGVDTVLWLKLVDQAPVPNYADTYQAGLYYLNGQPKPAATAFRFPFVTRRLDRRHILAWGRGPTNGRLSIEVRRGHRWAPIRTVRVRQREVYQVTLTMAGRAVLRARLGGQTSLTWTQPS